MAGNAKDGTARGNRGARPALPEGGKGETRDQFVVSLLIASRGKTARHMRGPRRKNLEMLTSLLARSVVTLALTTRTPRVRMMIMREVWNTKMGTMHNYNIVSKSRKVEKRRLHKQRQRANVSAKLESYEDLEARMDRSTWSPLLKGTSMKTPTAP